MSLPSFLITMWSRTIGIASFVAMIVANPNPQCPGAKADALTAVTATRPFRPTPHDHQFIDDEERAKSGFVVVSRLFAKIGQGRS